MRARTRRLGAQVVPYNPWITLYFTAHINVEVVCSATNVLVYLFKLLKCARAASAASLGVSRPLLPRWRRSRALSPAACSHSYCSYSATSVTRSAGVPPHAGT